MNEPENDPISPVLVWARRPGAVPPEWVRLYVHPATIDKWTKMGSMAKLGEYVGLVHGRFPDGDFPPGTTGLIRPRRIFKGLKRPLHDGFSPADKEVVTYVTNPERNYRLVRGATLSIREAPRPANAVFTTFVSFRPQVVDAVLQSVHQDLPDSVRGVVIHWEWTEASSKDPRLPHDYDTRYEEPLL